MTSGQAEFGRHSDRDTHWLATLASLAVGASFFALWFWLLPPWLGFHVAAVGAMRWRWIAAVPSVLGFAVALRCVWDFGWAGHGTPAPLAVIRDGTRRGRPGPAASPARYGARQSLVSLA